MLFNSVHFLFFFPVVVLLYFLLPPRRRWLLLLIASYYFYMSWEPAYALLIVASTLVDYYAGLRMGALPDKGRRRKYLALSLVANLGLLFTFKYFNFFRESAGVVLAALGVETRLPVLDVLLPVGISFYTFQTLSYSFDVYAGRKEPERHLGIFALYVSFFPQLVAGPIERSTRLLPQFHQVKPFDHANVVAGAQLMLWGLFKKIAIADRLGAMVDTVYAQPGGHSGAALILATYFFAFQIYCDFSGYSDIAIGAARIFGYDLMENFRRPYHAASISDFWKRWHISLSTWFRDYFYISLGGSRVGVARWQVNLLLTFLVSGLWHGANWTFVVWGALHGGYLIASIWIGRAVAGTVVDRMMQRLPGVSRLLLVVVNFQLVCFAWIFFRAQSVGDAFHIIANLFNFTGAALPFASEELGLAIGLIVFLEAVHLVQTQGSIRSRISLQPVYLRWAIYYTGLLAVLYFGIFDSHEFIYFQF